MQSPILQKILPQLQIVDTASKTSHIKFFDTLKVLMLEKKQVMYVTDGFVIVQAIKQVQNNSIIRDDYPKPFNRIRTNYYNFNTRYAPLFKFNQEDIDEGQKYPSVYKPEFHFQERIDQYKDKMINYEFSNITDTYYLTHWGFRIVNIANSGYYGIVLQVFNMVNKGEKLKVLPNLHSILYQPSLVSILESLRLKDMRNQLGEPKRDNISLCYYRKNTKFSHVTKMIASNFVTVDKGRIIKSKPEIKQSYIALGNITGILRFIRPLAKYSQTKKITINFNLIPQIPQTNQLPEPEIEQIWQSQAQEDDRPIQIQQQDSSYGEQETDQQDEPLKLIYLRQLQKNHIV